MFSGSPLNRLSWLRDSHNFLNSVAASPKSQWLLFKSGNPLTTKSDSKSHLAFLSTQEVGPLIGESPYFGQGKETGILTSEEQVSTTESVRHRGGPIIFLGLHEPPSSGSGALPSSDFKDAEKAVAKLEGTSYFALDVSDLEIQESEIDTVLNETEVVKAGGKLIWLDGRSVMMNVDHFYGAIFAEARSMCDWNSRNKVCSSYHVCSSIVWSHVKTQSFAQAVVPPCTLCGEVGSWVAQDSCPGQITLVANRVHPGEVLSCSISIQSHIAFSPEKDCITMLTRERTRW